MARKKLRAPSPSPPPPSPPRPREEPSSEEEEEEEGEAEATAPATQKASQTPSKPPASTDADSSDGGEEEEEEEKEEEEESSDSETDASAFQVAPSAGKTSESDADEADSSSSDSPPRIQKKKPKAESGKKRRAAQSSPSPSGGKAKKRAKADLEKAAPPPPPPPSRLNASRKGKKHVPDRSPCKPAVRRWTTEDEIRILEALVSHIKLNRKHPSALELIDAIGDSLERKNCSKTEMYEKVRNLRQRHEKAAGTGTMPGNDEDLRKYNLSEQVWGESAKEAAVSQNAGASSKSNKAQINKEKLDDHSKGGAAKKAAIPVSPVKSKKQGNHKEGSEEDAKADTTKETTNAATQNGGALVRSKSGKPDKEKNNVGVAEGLGPKEAVAVTQNDDAPLAKMRRGFDELQNLYPNLTSYVHSIQARHPCGETLKRVFELIDDDTACALEAKIEKQRVAEMKMAVRVADTKKEVANALIGLMD